MNPTHREFFIKLRALCNEYNASLTGAESGLLSVSVEESRYRLGYFDGDVTSFIQMTELVRHRIDEEPQP